MWANFVTWWTGNPVVRWITFIVLALLGWEVVKRHLKEAGRDAERKAIAIKQAEEQRRVDATRHEITEGNNELRRNADEAVSNLPKYSATERLRRDDADLANTVLGPDPGRGS